MKNTNWLGNAFEWLGEVFERFNPSAFRFLAAVLPYLTPIPVAWLTSHSASVFLGFTPNVSFIFVFSLEGIGLWFTSLLVDSVVEWIRGKDGKAFVMVLIFGAVVVAYITILVNLNVTLESSLGTPNPALSKIITLLCFLPLLTGVGNGYYKLKLDFQKSKSNNQRHQEEIDAKIREEQRTERLEKYRIKYGSSRSSSETNTGVPKDFRNSNETSKTTSGTMGRPSIHQERVFQFMEQQYLQTKQVPTFKEVMNNLNLPQSTASRLRDKWIENKRRGI